jgi:tetratricopeptide (TPR) repeat protein
MFIPVVLVVSLVVQPGFEALNAAANRQFRAGNFEQAEQTCRRALEAAEKERGTEDPATALIRGNLAATERALGRYAAAEELAVRSIAVLERNVGPRSVLLVPSLNTLGGVYIDMRRYGEAEVVLKRALRLRTDEAGAHYATSLHDLAAVYYLTGRANQAAKLYDKALRIRLRLFGPEDPLTRATARNISALWDRLGGRAYRQRSDVTARSGTEPRL